MFRLDEVLKVYLHREPIDFRPNINGLALLVEKALGLDPFAPCAYDRDGSSLSSLGAALCEAPHSTHDHLLRPWAAAGRASGSRFTVESRR